MHWRSAFLVATILVVSARPTFADPTPTTRPTKIVGHRGASFDAPENTLASYREAFAQHADAIEGDFWLTADGRVVDAHDETFLRTTGVDRKVGEMTLDEIKRLDVGAWKDVRFAGERVPTLEEILAILPADTSFFVEVKGGRDVVAAIARIVARQSRVSADQLRIIAFDADNIAEAKRLMPTVKAFWLTTFKPVDGTTHPTLTEVLATLDRVRADGLDAQADPAVIDATFAGALANKGYALHVWTVDDPAVARQMIGLGAQSVTTNRPAFMRDALSR